ncbi:MAG: hypothetical protein AAF184_11750 [Pseudomonadota bacterium]
MLCWKKISGAALAVALMPLAAPAEQCLDVWASVETDGWPGHAISLMLPLETDAPRRFPGGRGIDHVASFHTSMAADGTITLYTQLVDKAAACEPLKAEHTFALREDRLVVGSLQCGDSTHQLVLDFRAVVERPTGCW